MNKSVGFYVFVYSKFKGRSAFSAVDQLLRYKCACRYMYLLHIHTDLFLYKHTFSLFLCQLHPFEFWVLTSRVQSCCEILCLVQRAFWVGLNFVPLFMIKRISCNVALEVIQLSFMSRSVIGK